MKLRGRGIPSYVVKANHAERRENDFAPTAFTL